MIDITLSRRDILRKSMASGSILLTGNAMALPVLPLLNQKWISGVYAKSNWSAARAPFF